MNYEMKRGFAGPAEDTRVLWNANETRFTALAASEDAAYWVDFEMDAPIADTYIMVPACAYDGNRFEAVARRYPPMFLESELGVDVPVRMTQVPRLAMKGDSFMDVTTGDMATPCVCVLNRRTQQAFTGCRKPARRCSSTCVCCTRRRTRWLSCPSPRC